MFQTIERARKRFLWVFYILYVLCYAIVISFERYTS